MDLAGCCSSGGASKPVNAGFRLRQPGLQRRKPAPGRKDDTRRKILIGGYVLALFRDKADEPEAVAIRAGFKTFVEDAKRPDYSQLFSEFFAEPSPK